MSKQQNHVWMLEGRLGGGWYWLGFKRTRREARRLLSYERPYYYRTRVVRYNRASR